jgi:hypothetical protein
VREAEDSALLETVTRDWLVTTWHAGKGLAGDVVNCKLILVLQYASLYDLKSLLENILGIIDRAP